LHELKCNYRGGPEANTCLPESLLVLADKSRTITMMNGLDVLVENKVYVMLIIIYIDDEILGSEIF
jgi:hypothetical protein